MRKNPSQPSQELLDKVRTIAAYSFEPPAEVKAKLKEDAGENYLGKLIALNSELKDLLSKMHISIEFQLVSRGPFVVKRKGNYRVVEKGAVCLEFIDRVDDYARTLESVCKYEPGDWEHKLDTLFQVCLSFNRERGTGACLGRTAEPHFWLRTA